ncbi:hypothetical protein FB639_005349 [Coemansia asiatica]|nr:hypothetical protein FB639_005349 [Coemansia asiatica]
MKLAVTKLAAKKSSKKKLASKDNELYIHDLSQDQLEELKEHCVLADPGRHDLLCCIHEKSTADNPWTSHYTCNQLNRERHTSHFKKIQEKAKDTTNVIGVHDAELMLASVPHCSVDPECLIHYVQTRALVEGTLRSFYEGQMTTHASSIHPVHVKRLNYEACNHPLHRKLRLSAFINKKQADAWLIRNLKKKYGNNMVMVVGNWSATMVKYHEPIRGVGLRRMLRAGGITTYLIDKF